MRPHGRPRRPAPRVVEVEQLKDNLYLMRGGGGNSAVFIMADGVIVVDTKNPGWGQPLLDKIKSVTGKPIVRIINTHTHGDHVSGNVEFPATVEVVTHENTAKNMQEMKSPTGITPAPGAPVNIFKDNNGKGLPQRTFKDKMSIGKGADQIDLYYFGRGHTNGDAWVVFPALGVMHAGDIFSGKNIPLLDAVNGGSGVLIGDTLAKAAKDVKNVRQHHPRSQHRDDRRRPRGVRGVQHRLQEHRAGRQEGGPDRGSDRRRLQDPANGSRATPPPPKRA